MKLTRFLFAVAALLTTTAAMAQSTSTSEKLKNDCVKEIQSDFVDLDESIRKKAEGNYDPEKLVRLKKARENQFNKAVISCVANKELDGQIAALDAKIAEEKQKQAALDAQIAAADAKIAAADAKIAEEKQKQAALDAQIAAADAEIAMYRKQQAAANERIKRADELKAIADKIEPLIRELTRNINSGNSADMMRALKTAKKNLPLFHEYLARVKPYLDDSGYQKLAEVIARIEIQVRDIP